jgi:hypothetical protein
VPQNDANFGIGTLVWSSPRSPGCLPWLLVDDPAQVPDTFTLVQKGPVAALWKCRVVWRSDSHIGVTFDVNRAT